MEQTNSAGMSSPQQSVRGLSFKGILQVFTQPSTFFDRLKNDPKILVPYILLAILFVLMAVIMGDLILRAQIDSPQMQERLQGRTLTEQEQVVQKIASQSFLVVFMLIAPLLSAALAMLVGNFFMGLKASFTQILSVVLYANIIYAIGNILVGVMMVAKGSMAISLSAAVLIADQGVDSIAYVALSKISLINIWEIIAAGIGLAAVYNVPRNKGYLLSVLSVGMLSILHIVFTAIGKAVF